MEQNGKWVTINGAHVFIKDGEEAAFRKPTLVKTVKKKTEEEERKELARKIAREIYGKGISDELADRYGDHLLEIPDGYVFDEDEETYTGKNKRMEYSTKSLKEWLRDLKKSDR